MVLAEEAIFAVLYIAK